MDMVWRSGRSRNKSRLICCIYIPTPKTISRCVLKKIENRSLRTGEKRKKKKKGVTTDGIRHTAHLVFCANTDAKTDRDKKEKLSFFLFLSMEAGKGKKKRKKKEGVS